MKPIICSKRNIALTAVAILTYSTFAQGPSFDQLLQRNDKNGNGSLEKEEMTQNTKMFKSIDQDKDGIVTKNEFDTAVKTRNNRRAEEGRNRFETQGLQIGQKMPELTVYTLDGKPVPLSNLWKDKPAVLVTASATCPISVGSCPSLKPLSKAYAEKVNVGILYVKEAHPTEGETAPSSKVLGARTHPQPTTFEEKLKLARLFNENVEHGTTVYVDDIERTADTAIGAGPNIGLLIDIDGTIKLRQGWFKAQEMEAAIDASNKESTPPKKRQIRSRELPDGVIAHKDIEYAVADEESLKLDLYLPKSMNPAPPLMVWIHGGGWKNGDKANVNSAILRLAGEGYAVASINYRLKDLSIHPKNIHDCKGAVRWLRANAETYGYDPDRVAVGGGSAGGHLALLLGMSSGVEELEGTVGGNTNQSTAVKAIVDLYGPSDLKVMAETQERFNRVHDFESGQLASASPLRHLTKDDPPVLILHGDKDGTVPVEQGKLLHERYQKAGLESELHIIEGAGHGGMAFNDEERYQLIKAFLDRHL